jgi:hypothetical protein
VVGGRSRGNCAPVVLTGLSGASVTGTVGVATSVGATVGVGITGGAETPVLPVVGTVGGDDGRSDAWGCDDWAGWGCDALRSLTSLGSFNSALPFVVAFLLRLLTLMVGQGGDGPEANICGWRPCYVPPLVCQEAGNPICAILLGHVGLPGSQVFVPGCTSSAGRVDLQVGVRVDYRELPDNLAAPPLAGWQYQALVECPNLSEVGLVRQPGVMSLHVRDHVLHRLQPVGPLSRRELLPPGHGVWAVCKRVHPLATQMAEEAMALPLVEVGPGPMSGRTSSAMPRLDSRT